MSAQRCVDQMASFKIRTAQRGWLLPSYGYRLAPWEPDDKLAPDPVWKILYTPEDWP